MLADQIDRAIVETIIHVAKATGKTTIAECVQDRATLQELRMIGVDYAQGHAISAEAFPARPRWQLLQDTA